MTAWRPYAGPVRAVVFDWAGTTVDFGSLAPVRSVTAVFAALGVTVTEAEARGPMGLPKRDHLRAMLAVPALAGRWRAAHGTDPDEAAVEALYARFEPLQVEVVAGSAAPIPGTVETVAALRARGIAIGSTTGYSRAVMDALAPAAARLGYAPDGIVCPDDVPAGRPAPFMAWRSLIDLGAWPAAAGVKVDDTAPGIAEGRNAGMWTVGVRRTGNLFGLDEAAVAVLPPDELTARDAAAERALTEAGAHVTIAGIADLMPAIDDMERRLRAGRQP
jgi:phosphonoacetaldehyde hydrolase